MMLTHAELKKWLLNLERSMWVKFPNKGLEVCILTGVVRRYDTNPR